MKLSDAIMLGSVGTEQGFGASAIDPQGKRTCALGAALFAVGEDLKGHAIDGFNAVYKHWAWTEMESNPPDGTIMPCMAMPVWEIIWRLNDTYKWTRPQIAAWVATIEPQEQEEPKKEFVPEVESVEIL